MTSETARRAMNAAETDKVFLELITIEHDDLPFPLHFVANNDDIVSRGDMYLGAPVELILPEVQKDEIPQGRFRISTVSDPEDPDHDVVVALRNLGGISPLITLEVVLASSPDVVERSAPEMLLSNVEFDGLFLEGILTYDNPLSRRYPADTYNRVDWPGVHA